MSFVGGSDVDIKLRQVRLIDGDGHVQVTQVSWCLLSNRAWLLETDSEVMTRADCNRSKRETIYQTQTANKWLGFGERWIGD